MTASYAAPGVTLFEDTFESGSLSTEWSTNSTDDGRVSLTRNDYPKGKYHVTMDSSVVDSYSLNELILTLDLTGKTGVLLSFFAQEFGDENHPMPTSFTGSGNYDGVAISEDGSTWYRVVDLGITMTNFQYDHFVVDLDTAVTSAGISYNSSFKIKFQQYDNDPITIGTTYYDGITFDEIQVTASAPVCIDNDEDGYGDPGDPSCENGAATDCDDNDDQAYPGQTWYEDVDGDFYSSGNIISGQCERPTNYYSSEELMATSGDCDDNDPIVNPGATDDPGDDGDENCSGVVVCYDDSDADGYGTTTSAESTFTATAGVADTTNACGSNDTDAWDDTSDDCNDGDGSVNPGATDDPGDDGDENCSGVVVCYDDSDADGYGTTTSAESTLTATAGVADTTNACGSNDTDAWDDTSDDCNDGDGSVNPGATDDPGDDGDENCSGVVVCYDESDADGYGTTTSAESTFTATAGVADTTNACGSNDTDAWDDTSDDCNDGDGSVNPGATDDPGDDWDENCSGVVVCHNESDADGYGTTTSAESTFTATAGVADTAGACGSNDTDVWDDTSDDCNDGDGSVNPGATDDPGDDGDENCSGEVVCYDDGDADGYGTTTSAESTFTATAGVADTAGACGSNDTDVWDDTSEDCNDGDSAVNPGATEICNDTDDNCAAGTDEGCDDDNDNYCDSAMTIVGTPVTCTSGGGDCNDADAGINPGAAEIPDDSIDQDCNGSDTITCIVDADQDGYGTDLGTTTLAPDGTCDTADSESTTSDDCDDSDSNIYPGGPPVRISGSPPSYYWALQDAYDDPIVPDNIYSQDTLLTEDIDFNLPISVIFKGGYNCDYTAITGTTTINGNVTVSDGVVTIGNFIIE